eukprot:XP_001610354.1 hypothetical protein [Babesia bovis T2Bo]
MCNFVFALLFWAIKSECYHLPSQNFFIPLISSQGCNQRFRQIYVSPNDVSELLQPNEITILNRQTSHYIDEKLIYDTCWLYRNELGFPDFQVDVIFLDTKEMTECNSNHFGKHHATDIISLAENSLYTKDKYNLNRSPQLVADFRNLGEINMCPDYIYKQMIGDQEYSNQGVCQIKADKHCDENAYDHVEDNDFEEMLLQEDRLLDVFERFYETRNT